MSLGLHLPGLSVKPAICRDKEVKLLSSSVMSPIQSKKHFVYGYMCLVLYSWCFSLFKQLLGQTIFK